MEITYGFVNMQKKYKIEDLMDCVSRWIQDICVVNIRNPVTDTIVLWFSTTDLAAPLPTSWQCHVLMYLFPIAFL